MAAEMSEPILKLSPDWDDEPHPLRVRTLFERTLVVCGLFQGKVPMQLRNRLFDAVDDIPLIIPFQGMIGQIPWSAAVLLVELTLWSVPVLSVRSTSELLVIHSMSRNDSQLTGRDWNASLWVRCIIILYIIYSCIYVVALGIHTQAGQTSKSEDI